MAKFNGYLNLGRSFGIELESYLINDKTDYYNKSAMIVDTMMQAGLSLLWQAEIYRQLSSINAEIAKKKACAIMNTLYVWKVRPEKRPSDCATSWLEDAWCTLHHRYKEYIA